jgi:uncharacterized protein (TIGR03083 family)
MLPSPAMEDPGRWPDVRDLARAELESYLADASDPASQDRPTRCPPWTVADLTRHLAATAARFNAMLAQSRAGDLRPPFERNALSEENLRAVREFTGDPLASLREEAGRFLEDSTDPDEIMAHQFGPIPVGLQQHFLLNDIAIHHDDLAAAVGRSYRPPDAVVDALGRLFTAHRWWNGPENPDAWARILSSSGR